MKQKKRGLLFEVIIIFAFGTLLIGLFTFFTQQVLTASSIKGQTETLASDTADMTDAAIKEYPSYKWLIVYWRDHAGELQIEYDVDYNSGEATKAKAEYLNQKHPDVALKYAETGQIQSWSAEDQKLYAEVAYTWIVTRLDQIKSTNNLSFLFVLLTDPPYREQFFLLSGAEEGEVRGTEYGQIYTLGVTSTVSQSQETGMREAREHKRGLVEAGDYTDYYVYVEDVDNQELMIGLTYDVSELNKMISSRTWNGTILTVILELLLAWVCLGMIYRVVLQPLKTVQENIRLYMERKDSKEVCSNLAEIKSSNEIGQLSRDVSELTVEIDDYVDRITKFTGEKERIKAELSLASNIQTSLLPNSFPAFPERSEFNVYASMDPARVIGGDFYNFFLIDDDHLCVLIADVSGKGIPAAMFMMATQIILKNNGTEGKSPAKIMEDTNEMLVSKNPEDMFVTVWLGILEISTGKMTAANAGHEYPAICRKDGRFELFKDEHSMIVGGMSGLKYKEYDLQFEPGDRLFVYTDGVPEATDPSNNMFGTDRMIDALNEEAETPEKVLENVRNAVDAFISGAEQFDDLTMLCMEYKGSNEAG